MRLESRVFNVIGAALLLAAGIYAWWTDKDGPSVEWVGTLALVLSGVLAVMCGLYFGFVARRIEPRPEDLPEADIADGAGDIGFFSPGSYWPAGIAIAVALAGIGIALEMVWLTAVGLIGTTLGACALLFEYYTGTTRRGPL